MQSIGDIATWVGSVAAVTAIGFGFYQWRKSSQIRLSVKSFRVVSGLLEITWMDTQVEIYNIGRDTTTIRGVKIEDTAASPAMIWTKIDSSSQPLPYELAPGKFWKGHADTDITELMVSSIGPLVKISIDYSHSDKPYQQRFKPERIY